MHYQYETKVDDGRGEGECDFEISSFEGAEEGGRW